VQHIVFATLDELNAQRSASNRLAKSADTILAGEGGSLDSLAFVNLVVGIERRLDEELGLVVTFFDDDAMDLAAGPFRTVGALIDHIAALAAQRADV
jgi:acyl carrier protein